MFVQSVMHRLILDTVAARKPTPLKRRQILLTHKKWMENLVISPFEALLELTKANSPVVVEVLKSWLENYPLKAEKDLLIHGFTFGFRIPYAGVRGSRFSKNHSSAKLRPDLVLERFNEEIQLGQVAGPFDLPPLKNLVVSPIGLVPKSTPGEYRLIFDLSFPQGNSVNSGIPRDEASVSYTKFDEITKLVRHEGVGSYLVKIDIKSAFRLLPIHPEDFELLGMHYQGKYYIDKCLPFGLSVSCALFEKFSTFLEWCLKHYTGSDQIIHYLDDFAACDRRLQGAKSILDNSLDLFSSLGVPIADNKIEGPSTSIKFLGLEVDTVAMMVKLPLDKLHDLRLSIDNLLKKQGEKITLRELQSMIGKLNFACRAVRPGRAFCRRLIDATCDIKKPYHRVRLSKDMAADLHVWKFFLDNFNGASMMIDICDELCLDLFTDASGSIGYGAYFDGHWVAAPWPKALQKCAPDITFKELFPIVLAIYLWGHHFANKKVIFHCDNQAVVCMINKQTTRSPSSMHLVRCLVSVCLVKNIVFKAVHIPGLENNIADALSRLQFSRFRKLVPLADLTPTPIHAPLFRQLMGKYADC